MGGAAADNRPMLQVYRAGADVGHWIDGAVRIALPSGGAPSRFPATPHAMLTWRRPATGRAGVGPITFHTLSTVPTVHPHDGPTVAMGLLVRPAAAACLLGASTGVLVNRVLPWGLLAGAAEAARAEEDLHRAAHDAARLQALMASLSRTLQRVSQGREPSIAQLCDRVGLRGAAAAAELGVGTRQLQRRVQATLGLTPKQYQRLVRFHVALGQAVSVPAPPGAELALEAGFYDQSHFGRDLRQLAGQPLAHLRQGAQPGAAWWALAPRRLINAGRGPVLALA